MQKNVVIQLHIGNATGRNILAGILKQIKDGDRCTIRIASGNDEYAVLIHKEGERFGDAGRNHTGGLGGQFYRCA